MILSQVDIVKKLCMHGSVACFFFSFFTVEWERDLVGTRGASFGLGRQKKTIYYLETCNNVARLYLTFRNGSINSCKALESANESPVVEGFIWKVIV